jgi:hypothetical protein
MVTTAAQLNAAGYSQQAQNVDITDLIPCEAGAIELDIELTSLLNQDPSPYAPYVEINPNAQPAFGPTIPGTASTPVLPVTSPAVFPNNSVFAHDNPVGVAGEVWNVGRFPGGTGTRTMRFCKEAGQSIRLCVKTYLATRYAQPESVHTCYGSITAVRFYPSCTPAAASNPCITCDPVGNTSTLTILEGTGVYAGLSEVCPPAGGSYGPAESIWYFSQPGSSGSAVIRALCNNTLWRAEIPRNGLGSEVIAVTGIRCGASTGRLQGIATLVSTVHPGSTITFQLS